MNWTKASAVAEILSSAAVLITLIYLVVEIGQNTAALEATSREALLENSVQTLQQVIAEPALWLDQVKPNLTDEERVRLSAHLFTMTQRGQIAWQQLQVGALDEATWARLEGPLIDTLSHSESRKWWTFFDPESEFEPTFREHVNGLLEDRPIVTQLSDIQAFD